MCVPAYVFVLFVAEYVHRLSPRPPPALVSVPDGLRQGPGSYCLQARECARLPLVAPLLLPQDQ